MFYSEKGSDHGTSDRSKEAKTLRRPKVSKYLLLRVSQSNIFELNGKAQALVNFRDPVILLPFFTIDLKLIRYGLR